MATGRDRDSGRAKVFVVDDDPAIRRIALHWLEGQGYEAKGFEDGPSVLAELKHMTPDVVCLDLRMQPLDGREVLARIHRVAPDLPVLFLTGDDSAKSAVEIMKAGALDYLVKPLERDPFLLAIRNATKTRALTEEVHELRARLSEQDMPEFAGLVGASSAMRDLFRQLRKVARADVSVMLLGESGTGKELIARALHQLSGRSDQQFVPLNCGAVPAQLLESELFGHKRGAFTGATENRKGRFEQADRGTLFLDEIGELEPQAQVRLLRVLQEGTFERVGDHRSIDVDVRVVSATHRALETMVADGGFRQDLYFRLMVFPIYVPPLRDRGGDVQLLANHFLSKHGRGRDVRFTAEALAHLDTLTWPGNVRELENVVQYALVQADGDVLTLNDLPPNQRPGAGVNAAGAQTAVAGSVVGDAVSTSLTTPEGIVSMEELERRAVVQALEATDGNVSLAARRLGMGRTTLYRKLQAYGLSAR